MYATQVMATGEKATITLDYIDLIEADEELLSPLSYVLPAGLTIENVDIDNEVKAVTFLLGGAQRGHIYDISTSITTSYGQIIKQGILVRGYDAY